MSKKSRSKEGTAISEELAKLIRVTPEMTQASLSKFKHTITPRPEGERAPKGKLWCPYCAKWSKFTVRSDLNLYYRRSHCCGISVEDYYVKTHNKLW